MNWVTNDNEFVVKFYGLMTSISLSADDVSTSRNGRFMNGRIHFYININLAEILLYGSQLENKIENVYSIRTEILYSTIIFMMI